MLIYHKAMQCTKEGHYKGNGVLSSVVQQTTIFVQPFVDEEDLMRELVVKG